VTDATSKGGSTIYNPWRAEETEALEGQVTSFRSHSHSVEDSRLYVSWKMALDLGKLGLIFLEAEISKGSTQQ
jgi:hypothetical protein